MHQRIQMRRTAGWRKPEGVIYVGRPSKWGNPFRVDWESRIPGWWLCLPSNIGEVLVSPNNVEQAVALYRLYMLSLIEQAEDDGSDLLSPLRGKDLACWCANGKPCHADILLELANQ